MENLDGVVPLFDDDLIITPMRVTSRSGARGSFALRDEMVET